MTEGTALGRTPIGGLAAAVGGLLAVTIALLAIHRGLAPLRAVSRVADVGGLRQIDLVNALQFRRRLRVALKHPVALDDDEAALVRRFYDGIEKYTPQLVSWNGGGFDLPVLNYRALINGVTATRFWEWGDEDRSFNYNNYISRYHKRHLDLMDILAFYQARANAPLDEVAKLCGFPGKLGFDGSQVWDAWCDGKIEGIRNYCETDVANTYLVFLRFQRLRGALDEGQYQQELALVRTTLARANMAHWRDYLEAWPTSTPAQP